MSDVSISDEGITLSHIDVEAMDCIRSHWHSEILVEYQLAHYTYSFHSREYPFIYRFHSWHHKNPYISLSRVHLKGFFSQFHGTLA